MKESPNHDGCIKKKERPSGRYQCCFLIETWLIFCLEHSLNIKNMTKAESSVMLVVSSCFSTHVWFNTLTVLCAIELKHKHTHLFRGSRADLRDYILSQNTKWCLVLLTAGVPHWCRAAKTYYCQ